MKPRHALIIAAFLPATLATAFLATPLIAQQGRPFPFGNKPTTLLHVPQRPRHIVFIIHLSGKVAQDHDFLFKDLGKSIQALAQED